MINHFGQSLSIAEMPPERLRTSLMILGYLLRALEEKTAFRSKDVTGVDGLGGLH